VKAFSAGLNSSSRIETMPQASFCPVVVRAEAVASGIYFEFLARKSVDPMPILPIGKGAGE